MTFIQTSHELNIEFHSDSQDPSKLIRPIFKFEEPTKSLATSYPSFWHYSFAACASSYRN